jgi:hypothetical protein
VLRRLPRQHRNAGSPGCLAGRPGLSHLLSPAPLERRHRRLPRRLVAVCRMQFEELALRQLRHKEPIRHSLLEVPMTCVSVLGIEMASTSMNWTT